MLRCKFQIRETNVRLILAVEPESISLLRYKNCDPETRLLFVCKNTLLMVPKKRRGFSPWTQPAANPFFARLLWLSGQLKGYKASLTTHGSSRQEPSEKACWVW